MKFLSIIFLTLSLVACSLDMSVNSQSVKAEDHNKVAITITTQTLTVSGPNMERPVEVVLVKDLKGKILSKTCIIKHGNASTSTSVEFCDRVYKAIE